MCLHSTLTSSNTNGKLHASLTGVYMLQSAHASRCCFLWVGRGCGCYCCARFSFDLLPTYSVVVSIDIHRRLKGETERPTQHTQAQNSEFVTPQSSEPNAAITLVAAKLPDALQRSCRARCTRVPAQDLRGPKRNKAEGEKVPSLRAAGCSSPLELRCTWAT